MLRAFQNLKCAHVQALFGGAARGEASSKTVRVRLPELVAAPLSVPKNFESRFSPRHDNRHQIREIFTLTDGTDSKSSRGDLPAMANVCNG